MYQKYKANAKLHLHILMSWHFYESLYDIFPIAGESFTWFKWVPLDYKHPYLDI